MLSIVSLHTNVVMTIYFDGYLIVEFIYRERVTQIINVHTIKNMDPNINCLNIYSLSSSY